MFLTQGFEESAGNRSLPWKEEELIWLGYTLAFATHRAETTRDEAGGDTEVPKLRVEVFQVSAF
jgi:hypothetical protein